MDRASISSALTEIMRDIFDEDDLVVDESTCADDVADWDSANHVRLIIAVEGEFDIRFETDEITAPETVGELIDLIQAKVTD